MSNQTKRNNFSKNYWFLACIETTVCAVKEQKEYQNHISETR